MLQFSSLLELQAHKLRRDALQVINAAISGSATTNFWNLMENFFGVDEDPSESLMEDAASMVAIMKARKAELEKDEKAQALSVSKEEEEELLDTASTTSSVASGARPKSLSQLKSQHAKTDTYPSKCPIASAQLFFPTSQQDLHQTGVPAKYIGHREGIGSYKGLYTCNYGDCDYGAQARPVVCTYIRRVHLGIAVGCRYCPTKCWWQPRYWASHMRESHPDKPIFEPLTMPGGELKAEPIDPEIFLTEEHFEIPDPKRAKVSPDPKVKKEVVEDTSLDAALSQVWSPISRRSHDICSLAQAPEGHPESARPKVAAIRYKRKSSEIAEMATSVVIADIHSTQQENIVEIEEESTKEQKGVGEDADIEVL